MTPAERAHKIAAKARLSWDDPTRLREEGHYIDEADWALYVHEVQRRHIGREASTEGFSHDPGQVHHCATLQETQQKWTSTKLFSLALRALRLRSYEDGLSPEQHTVPLGRSLARCHGQGSVILDFSFLTDEKEDGYPRVIGLLDRCDLPDTADSWRHALDEAAEVDRIIGRLSTSESLDLAHQTRDTCAVTALAYLEDERLRLIPALNQTCREAGDAAVDELADTERQMLLRVAPPWISVMLAEHWNTTSPWKADS